MNKSNKMLAYYSFQRKLLKCWKEVIFHLFDLSMVKTHMLHNEKNRKTSHCSCSMKFEAFTVVEVKSRSSGL